MNMHELGHKKIFSVIFVVSLFVYMMITLCSINTEQTSALANSSSSWDAKEAYPFHTETKENVTPQKTSPINRVSQIIDRLKTDIKNRVTSKNILYSDVAVFRKNIDRNLYGYNATTSLCGTENDLNDPRDLVVSHKSGFLSFVYDNGDTAFPMKKIHEFKQYLSDRGIDLLLFVPPFKDGEIDDSYSDVYHDYSSELLIDIINESHRYDVDIINFLDIAKKEGLNEEDLYFRTDHHWLPQSGLRGCSAISPWLSQRGYDIDTNIFDIKNYNVSYVKYPMLGSQGIKTTSAYTDVEYMPILEPLYSTDLTVENAEAGTVLTGSIKDTLYDYSMIDSPSLEWTKHFRFYSYGDQPLIRIHNNRRTDGKRLLVIKDSFARVMVPYMCNMAEYVDVIDLRHFDGSLKTYMKENTPDSVVIVYAVGTFIDKSHYVASSQYAFNFE